MYGMKVEGFLSPKRLGFSWASLEEVKSHTRYLCSTPPKSKHAAGNVPNTRTRDTDERDRQTRHFRFRFPYSNLNHIMMHHFACSRRDRLLRLDQFLNTVLLLKIFINFSTFFFYFVEGLKATSPAAQQAIGFAQPAERAVEI